MTGSLTVPSITVSGNTTTTFGGSFGFFELVDESIQTGVRSSQDVDVAISASSGACFAAQFVTASDERLKKHVRPLDTEVMTQAIQDSRPVSFEYIDTVSFDSAVHHGFIAQELSQVWPQAVRKVPGCWVPSIFSLGEATFDEIAVVSSMDTPPRVGDKVRVIAMGRDLVVTCVEVRGQTLVIRDHWFDTPTRVFVYGTETSQIHTIDFDCVVAGMVSVMQDMLRRLDALESTLSRM